MVVLTIAYGAVMAGMSAALAYGRSASLQNLGNPEAKQAWDEWRQTAPGAGKPGASAARRVSKSPEPPALVLMRDSFWSIVAVVWLITTFLFAFVAFTAFGAFETKPIAPQIEAK